MRELLEKLKEYGADTQGAMERFLNDVDLYKSCFTIFLKEEAFQQLGEALKEKHYEDAFTYAHTLKGITGNMGMTPLYQVICDMVEALRQQEYACLDEEYAKVMEQLHMLKKYETLCERKESEKNERTQNS